MPETSSLTHMDALPAGTRLGEFEIQALLGVGGFGMVYRAYDHTLHREVAIKEYMPAALVGRLPDLQVRARSNADQQPFERGLASFIAEARVLARFDHPSLVKVYRFWEANHTAYMAMPLYHGMTLKQARSQMSGPPPEAWLRTVLWSVLQALKVLHDGNTLHRDVSPDNVFLQDVGPPVLLDLGSARRAITEHSHKHTAVLKVHYAPIEQYADALDWKEGPWTDLYAMAAVVHGCVCNAPPVPATVRVVQDRMPPFAQVAHTAQTHFGVAYAADFCRVIDHALALLPTDRPQSAQDWMHEMGLHAPDGWAHFNWRTALGPLVTLDGAPPGDAMGSAAQRTAGLDATTQAMPATAHDPAPMATTITASEPLPLPGLLTAAQPQALPSLQWRWWGIALAAVLAIALAVVAVYRGHDVSTQLAPPPAPAPIGAPGKAALGKGAPARAAPNAETGSGSAEGAALCAHEPIWKRPLCIYQECRKPGMANSAACEEERKRREKAIEQHPGF